MATTLNRVYLVVHDMTGELGNDIALLVNHRNKNIEGWTDLVGTDSYQDLRVKYQNLEPKKGSGYDNFKEGVKYWVLPFEAHPLMEDPDPTFAVVLNEDEFNSFGWDEIEY